LAEPPAPPAGVATAQESKAPCSSAAVLIEQINEAEFRMSRGEMHAKLDAELARNVVQLLPTHADDDSARLTGLSSMSVLINIGFREGDVITSAGGRSVSSLEDLIDALREPPGSQLEVDLVREGTEVSLLYELSP
jgi:S1-C subfamily serine protease